MQKVVSRMTVNGIKRIFTVASGERLAAAAVGAIICSSTALAENWTYNFSQFALNESVPFTQTLDGNSGTIAMLLCIIAFCEVFQVLTKLMGWFMNDND